jgi:energy-coupling factor transport system permease protein
VVSHFGIFLPGCSRLHRLHPLTKLTFTLAAVIIVFGGPGKWFSALVPGLIALAILASAGLARIGLRITLRILVPLALMLLFVHGLFSPVNQNFILQLAIFKVGREGVLYAVLVILRLTAALFSSLVLVLSTHPAHLVQALEEAGLSPRFAYLFGSPLLLIPQLSGRIQSIRAAQQARGLEIQGNLLRRVKALFPLVAPLVFSALVDVEERALALEVRGFSAPHTKTYLNALQDSSWQRLLRWGMLALAVGLLAKRFVWA